MGSFVFVLSYWLQLRFDRVSTFSSALVRPIPEVTKKLPVELFLQRKIAALSAAVRCCRSPSNNCVFSVFLKILPQYRHFFVFCVSVYQSDFHCFTLFFHYYNKKLRSKLIFKFNHSKRDLSWDLFFLCYGKGFLRILSAGC